MKHAKGKRSGFALIEMAVVLVLMAVLAVLVGELFVISMRAWKDAEKRDNLLHKVDAALGLLRRDAWGASAMSVDGPRVDMTIESGERVTWRCMRDGAWTRTAGKDSATLTWRDVPSMTFDVNGPLLTLRAGAKEQEEKVTLVSERMLQGGGK